MKQNFSRNWFAALRPEQEIVLCCARAQSDAATKDRIRDLVRGDLHWLDVMAYAMQHRLLPIVYESISATAQDLVPPGQMLALHEAARASASNALLLLREFLRLQELFDGAQIPALPYKGPVLAWIAYGSFTRRDYTDLDFAVEQKYIPETASLLRSAGYSAQFDPSEAHAGKSGIAPGQYSFTSAVSGAPVLQVELHTERTLRYFPTPLDFEDLNGRLIDVELAAHRVRTFSIEETLVMLSVHGAKHFWERLSWVLDVAQLVTVQEVDWLLLLDLAAKMKSTRVLLLGLHLAHEVFGATLPSVMLHKIEEDVAIRKLAGEVCEQYAGISDPSVGIWRRAMFRIQSRDGLGQGFRHMLRLTMGPTESDRQAVRLLPVLAPLYMVVRPWRLVQEYGLGWKRQSKPDVAISGAAPSEKAMEETQPQELAVSELRESNKSGT